MILLNVKSKDETPPTKRARSWKRRTQLRINLQNNEPVIYSTPL